MEWNWIKALGDLASRGEPHVVVTVCGYDGSAPRNLGAKMIVTEKSLLGTIGGGHLEKKAIEAAKELLSSVTTVEKRSYPLGSALGQCCGGKVDLLFEKPLAGPMLYIFGAGHVGQALSRTVSGTAFQVHLIDDRKEWVESREIPGTVHRHCCEWDAFVDEAEWDKLRTYVAVMTYRHDMDQDIIADVIERPAKFIGLIGSESKWNRFQSRLTQRGVGEEKLKRVHCPIGLPTGGKAPQEVAVSIASQLLSVHYA